ISPNKGREILPSGLTWTCFDRSAFFHTVISRMSSGPIKYSGVTIKSDLSVPPGPGLDGVGIDLLASFSCAKRSPVISNAATARIKAVIKELADRMCSRLLILQKIGTAKRR